MTMSKIRFVAVLAGGLASGCVEFHDSQVESLDLAALGPDEGYVVGTISSIERHVDGEHPPVTTEAPDIDFAVIVREAYAPVQPGAAPEAYIQESTRTWDIGVQGELSPTLFALKLPVGQHHLESVELLYGNLATSTPIGLGFYVAPGVVTYIGNVHIELNTTESLFAMRLLKTVRSRASEDRALLDGLLAERFPDEPPEVHVEIAEFDEW
jgi:hypothetical protein